VRALFDYEATCEEELNLTEGALIRVTSMHLHDNSVDDGWWEGELDGVRGIFSSLVVDKVTNHAVVDIVTTLRYP